MTSPPLTITVGHPAVTSLSYGGETLDFQPFVESGGITKFVLCPNGTLAEKVSQCSELRAAMKAERIKNSVASVKKPQSIGRVDHELDSLAISTTGYGWVDVSNANGKELVSKVSVNGFERVIKASPPLMITVSKVGITKLSYKGKAMNAKPFADSNGLAKFVLCPDGRLVENVSQCSELMEDHTSDDLERSASASNSKEQRVDQVESGSSDLEITSEYSWVDVTDVSGTRLFSDLVKRVDRVELVVVRRASVFVARPDLTRVKYKGKEVDLRRFTSSVGNARFILCSDGSALSSKKDCPQP
jgi:hypothetical protein